MILLPRSPAVSSAWNGIRNIFKGPGVDPDTPEVVKFVDRFVTFVRLALVAFKNITRSRDQLASTVVNEPVSSTMPVMPAPSTAWAIASSKSCVLSLDEYTIGLLPATKLLLLSNSKVVLPMVKVVPSGISDAATGDASRS